MSLHIEWDPAKAASNLKKHGISFEIAATVFADPHALTIPDSEHSDSDPSRINIRIISARLATAHENRQYRG